MKGRSRKKMESFRMRLKKNILIPALAAVFLAAGMVGGTVAWIIANTDEVVNTFEPVKVEDEIIEEKFDGVIKKEVKISNKGNIATYVRVVLIPAWVDDDGKIAGHVPEIDVDYSISMNTEEWFPVKDSSGITYWYCSEKVEPSKDSPVLIKSCEPLVSKNGMDGTPLHFQLKVISSTIQAEPDKAVNEAWSEVEVSDGKLVPVKSGDGN